MQLSKTDKAYLIISVSITRPHFDQKIEKVLNLIENLKFIKVIFVYIAEAYSDDNWPMGYGIQEAKSLKERKDRCK